jgi:hypothetical protein
MFDSDRLVVTDAELARRIGSDILVGSVFAFLPQRAFSNPALAWAAKLFGGSREPRILSLLGGEGGSLPGLTVRAASLPRLSLFAVTSDKALYREGRDEVHLLVVEPLAPGASVVLEILVHGALFATREVRLDARGAAAVTLRELPTGDYQVRPQGAPDAFPACEFTVAEYRLAPLVMRLVERRLEGNMLAVKLFLESFGTPVTARVKLALMARGIRLPEQIVVVKNGVAEATFKLVGRGPHAINAQLVMDPSRTATVPIVGSREEERSRTVLSALGEEVGASLLPGASSQPVRGLWLDRGPIRSTPFHLERVDTRKARLTAMTAIDTAVLAVIDAAGEHQERELGALASGAVIEVEVPGPMGLLALGAFIQGEPWEGWAAVVTPSSVSAEISVPEKCTPGEEARIELDTGRVKDDASVYVVVKDARLLSSDTPASRLAGGLKAHAEGAGRVLSVGTVGQRLADVLPAPYDIETMYESGVVYSSADYDTLCLDDDSYDATMPLLGAPPPEEDYASPAEDDAPPAEGDAPPAEAVRGAAPPPRRAVQEPEVLFAGLVETRNGRASVPVRLGPGFADYLVEAFVLSGLDWAPAEARFRAEKAQFVSLELPAFVHPEDAALARLHVGSRLEGVRVRVLRDGVEVPLIRDGQLLAAGEPLGVGLTELTFLAGPGLYEALLEGPSGVLAREVKQVEEPGRPRRLARTVRLLEPEQALSVEEDASIVSLRVLPGLKGPFRALVTATADYGHACCEQTAAKMLAACAMYALAGEGSEHESGAALRAKAESIILAGVARERSMFLPGRGFKMYPENLDEPDTYWGPKAAEHLQHLALLKDLGGVAALGPALSRAVEEGLAMARDAMRAYQRTWPPMRMESSADAYQALRFGGGGREAEALAVARHCAEKVGDEGKGAVAMRAEVAYAAAVLLRAGGTAELPWAMALANWVIAQLGENGRLYSTVDSVAAISLLVELQAARVVGGEGVAEVDGERVPVAEVAASARAVRSVRALDSRVAVEVTRQVEEDWGGFHAKLPVAVSLLKDGSVSRQLTATDAVELWVRLESGYKPGDLLWVCLPDALSRVVGGGQVKQFSLDFAGEHELWIPLAATGVTVGRKGETAPARFAVCVRNMFEEERGGSPGYIEVTVAPSPGGSALGRTLDTLKHLFT